MLFFAVLAFGFLNVARGEEPRLVVFPSKGALHAPADKPFGLLCKGEAQNGDFANMEWMNNRGERIAKGIPGVKEYGLHGLKLSFVDPKVEDSGIYTCTALYGGTKTLKISTNLTFYDAIRFEDCEAEQRLVLGKEGLVRCRTLGYPRPDVIWQKDGRRLRSGVVTSAGLQIASVGEEDGGLYTIEAFVYETGTAEYRSIAVSVLSHPRIVELPEEFVVIEGEEYTIICRAEGAEPLTYSWFDSQLRDLSTVEGFRVEDGLLTILRAERSAGGVYICRVSNPVGQDEASFELQVQVRPSILQFENVTEMEGKTAKLECRAGGIPRPELSVRRGNSLQPLIDGQDDKIFLEEAEEDDLSVLRVQIERLRRSDDGQYFCQASNAAGEAEAAGHLEIQFRPDMSLTPSTLVKAWSTHPANLSCVAEANPSATLTWKYQNVPIEATDERYKIYGGITYGNLLVHTDKNAEFEIFGVYTCEARNTLGENSINIHLEEATVPGPITQIVFDKVTSTSITFRLMGPANTGGLPVTHYIMEYKDANNLELSAVRVEWPKDTLYIVYGLKPRAKYHFSAAARNPVGAGPWKSTVYVMPEEAVPEPPTITTRQEEVSDFPNY